METTPFLKSISKRFSSPLISTFVISWLVLNWKITIGLIFSLEQIKNAGHRSLFDLISCYLEQEPDHWFLPLVVALGYTIFFPWVTTSISLYKVFVKRIENNNAIKLNDSAFVTTDKLREYQREIKDKEKELQELVRKEKEKADYFIQQGIALEQARGEIEELKGNLEQARRQIQDIRFDSNMISHQITNYEPFVGFWELQYSSGNKIQLRISESGSFTLVSGTKAHPLTLNGYIFNPTKHILAFTVVDLHGKAYQYSLTVIDDKNLKGFGNGEHVHFTKLYES